MRRAKLECLADRLWQFMSGGQDLPGKVGLRAACRARRAFASARLAVDFRSLLACTVELMVFTLAAQAGQ